jgi:hypothetical protein
VRDIKIAEALQWIVIIILAIGFVGGLIVFRREISPMNMFWMFVLGLLAMVAVTDV